MNYPTFNFSELRKIEMQIGFTSGILVGVLASWVVILTTNWQWYFKVFSSIGEVGIVGSLVLTLNELIKARRNYLEIEGEMNKVENKIQVKGGNEDG